MNKTFSAVAFLALLLALGAAGGVGYLLFLQEKRSPQEKPVSALEKYDFSTPFQTVKSLEVIRKDNDVLALMDYGRIVKKESIEEELSTLELKKETEWRGNVYSFVTWKARGVAKYDVYILTKHAKSGFWMAPDPPVLRAEIEKDNKALADMMTRWEKAGQLEPEQAARK